MVVFERFHSENAKIAGEVLCEAHCVLAILAVWFFMLKEGTVGQMRMQIKRAGRQKTEHGCCCWNSCFLCSLVIGPIFSKRKRKTESAKQPYPELTFLDNCIPLSCGIILNLRNITRRRQSPFILLFLVTTHSSRAHVPCSPIHTLCVTGFQGICKISIQT